MLLRPSKSTVRYRRLSDDASTGSNVGASACIVIQELVSPQEFRSERNRCCERARKEEEDERAAVEPTRHFLSCHLQKWRSLSQRGTIPGSSSRRSPGAIGGALSPDVSPSHRSGVQPQYVGFFLFLLQLLTSTSRPEVSSSVGQPLVDPSERRILCWYCGCHSEKVLLTVLIRSRK